MSVVLSDDRKYRFFLSRETRYSSFDNEPMGGEILFVLLNPSTADEKTDDPTVRRCRGFADRWNYQTLLIVNTNPIRATNPKEAFIPPNPILEENDIYLRQMAQRAEKIICAWGANVNTVLAKRAIDILQKEKPLYALELTKYGIPKHPLYLKGSLQPFLWKEKI